MKRSEFIKFLAVLPAAPALLKGIIPEEEKTNVINEYTSNDPINLNDLDDIKPYIDYHLQHPSCIGDIFLYRGERYMVVYKDGVRATIRPFNYNLDDIEMDLEELNKYDFVMVYNNLKC